MSIITRPGFRVAKCGHEYATEATQGRQRLVGDCDCQPPKKPYKSKAKGTVTHSGTCAYCLDNFTRVVGRGPRPIYCSFDCKQKAAYRTRKAKLAASACEVEGCDGKVYSKGLCATH